MTKLELISAIAEKTNATKKDTEIFLNNFTEVVTKALLDKDEVKLSGFGTFCTVERAERQGRNPQTNEIMTIPASVVPKFKVSKTLKETIKNN